MYRHCRDGPDADRNLATTSALHAALPEAHAEYKQQLLDSWQRVLEAPLCDLVAAVEDEEQEVDEMEEDEDLEEDDLQDIPLALRALQPTGSAPPRRVRTAGV